MTTSSEHSAADQISEGRCWLTWILRVGACSCFAGWAWQHLRWSVPYDALLWNPDYFGWLSGATADSWESYVANVVTDRRILIGVRVLGIVHLVLCVLAVTARRGLPVQLIGLGIGSALLALLAFCKYINSGHSMALLVEYGGQVLMPTVLILALRRGVRDKWTVGVAIAAFCATFVGHGVFAVGLAPTPGHFYGMVAAILGLGEDAADLFLKVVGVLDFVVCIGVMVPVARAVCLGYAAVWGLLTAFARPVAGMSFATPWWGADQFLHEAVLRLPHAALPLFLFLVFRQQSETWTATEEPDTAT